MTLDDDWVVIPSLIEEPQVYACATCGTHLCTDGNIESKEFHTKDGRGFLVRDVINITNGPPQSRMLRTGKHTCEDVSCVSCHTEIGWQYTDTAERGQRYKIGLCVLGVVYLAKATGWGKDEGDDDDDDNNSSNSNSNSNSSDETDGFHLLDPVSH
eukprot:g10822.t1